MVRVALRGVRAHLVRFCLSVLAVALGVAFVAGTFALRTMLELHVHGHRRDDDARRRLRPRLPRRPGAPAGRTGSAPEVRNPVPLTLVDELEAVDGVAAGAARRAGTARPGRRRRHRGAEHAGAELRVRLRPAGPGRATWSPGGRPRRADEIAVESASLAASGLALGDATSVVVGGEVRPVTVVGEMGLGAALAGATVVFLDPETAEAAFAPDGTVATISVLRGRRADRAAAGGPARSRRWPSRASRRRRSPATRCASRPPRTSSRSSGSSRRSCWSSRGSRCSSAAFIIANTFSMWVRQRMRELALLRAVGASPLQVFTSIVLQAAIVGVVGAVARRRGRARAGRRAPRGARPVRHGAHRPGAARRVHARGLGARRHPGERARGGTARPAGGAGAAGRGAARRGHPARSARCAGARSSGIALVVLGVGRGRRRAAATRPRTTPERCSGSVRARWSLGVLAASPVLARGFLRVAACRSPPGARWVRWRAATSPATPAARRTPRAP